jgi:hemerythrin-like domain-containing protein
MLTTTYSLVAINLEQKNVYQMLSNLEQDIKFENDTPEGTSNADYLQKLLNKFLQVENYVRSRKVEIYVIPAIRKAAENIDSMLAEFDSLGDKTIRAALIEQLQGCIEKEILQADLLRSSMEQYCQSLLKKLLKEDEQLLPVARSILTGEVWFNIAVGCMSGETNTQGRKATGEISGQPITEHACIKSPSPSMVQAIPSTPPVY